MKPYPVNFRFRAQFDLMPGWVPQTLQDWLVECRTSDITVKRVKGYHSTILLRVEIEASTEDDLRAKRWAFNAMIEAQGYGPDALRKRAQKAKK